MEIDHPTVVPSNWESDGTDDETEEQQRRLSRRFQVRDCPHCGRTTVVDSKYTDQRCDWVDTCDELFDIGDADLSDDAWFDASGTLVRASEEQEITPNYGKGGVAR